MSRAFVQESDHADDGLPERAISPHPNLVTARGLSMLEARVRELEQARAAARSEGDAAQVARIARDLRYFQNRRDTARVISPLAEPSAVRFGVQVQLEDRDGRVHVYRIVGEDEADPAEGLISYVSPLAKELIGLCPGDDVPLGDGQATITGLTA